MSWTVKSKQWTQNTFLFVQAVKYLDKVSILSMDSILNRCKNSSVLGKDLRNLVNSRVVNNKLNLQNGRMLTCIRSCVKHISEFSICVSEQLKKKVGFENFWLLEQRTLWRKFVVLVKISQAKTMVKRFI